MAKLLGEAIVLTVLLGSALKFEGRFILQTQTDGPVRMLVVDFTTPGKVRACARFDAERVAAAIAAGEPPTGRAARPRPSRHDHRPGPGHEPLPGPGRARGQAISKTPRTNISCAPSRSRPACGSRSARNCRAGAGGARHRWRAGGMLLQFLPKAPERARQPDLDPGDAPEGTVPHSVPEDDAWVEGRSLVETVEDVELIDPDALDRAAALPAVPRARRAGLPLDRAQGASAPARATASPTCCKSFSQDDRDHMVENGVITVTCEFCNSTYVFEPAEVADAN